MSFIYNIYFFYIIIQILLIYFDYIYLPFISINVYFFFYHPILSFFLSFFLFPSFLLPFFSLFIDLTVIKARLKTEHYYLSPSLFKADLVQMCQNAMTYNAPDTEFHACGQRLLDLINKRYQMMRWPEWEGEILEEDLKEQVQDEKEASDSTSDDPFS